MNNFTVEAIELTRIYGGREAVSNVSFNLSKGEVLGFLGPNGAGKSTTIHCITGIAQPTSGQILIDGIDVVKDYKESRKKVGLFLDFLRKTVPLISNPNICPTQLT